MQWPCNGGDMVDSQRKGVNHDGIEGVEPGGLLRPVDGGRDQSVHGGSELPNLAGDGVRGNRGGPAGNVGGMAGNPEPEPASGDSGDAGLVEPDGDGDHGGKLTRLLARIRAQQQELSATLDRIRRNLT